KALRFAAAQHRRNVDLAGPLAFVDIAAEGIAAQVRVGKGEGGHLDAEARAVALPGELARQHVEGEARVGEDARQLELGAARVELHMAAQLARLERAVELREAGKLLARLQPEIDKTRARLVMRRSAERSLPFVAQARKPAARRELMRRKAKFRRQRQRLAEMRKRRELERARAQHAALGLPGDVELERRQRGAVLRREREMPGSEAVALAFARALQAADGRSEVKRRQIGGERRAHAGERHIGGRRTR